MTGLNLNKIVLGKRLKAKKMLVSKKIVLVLYLPSFLILLETFSLISKFSYRIRWISRYELVNNTVDAIQGGGEARPDPPPPTQPYLY